MRRLRPGYAPPYGTRRLAPDPRWRYIPAIQSAGGCPRWHPVLRGRAVRARRPPSTKLPAIHTRQPWPGQRPAARSTATGAGRQRRYAPVIQHTVSSPGNPRARGRARPPADPLSVEALGDPRTAALARQYAPLRDPRPLGPERQRRYAPAIQHTVRSPSDLLGPGRAGLARRPVVVPERGDCPTRPEPRARARGTGPGRVSSQER